MPNRSCEALSVYDLPERMQNKIHIGVDGCWVWTGGRSSSGYGNINWAGRKLRAHRVVWEYFHGPIPQGLVSDHFCHDPADCLGGVTCPHRACVNPSHVYMTTLEVNQSCRRDSRKYRLWQESRQKRVATLEQAQQKRVERVQIQQQKRVQQQARREQERMLREQTRPTPEQQRELDRLRALAYSRKHPEEHRARSRRYYQEHLEERRAYMREYKRSHRQSKSPDIVCEKSPGL